MAEEPTPKSWDRLRITAACFCLVLCICFVALWGSSYFKLGEFIVHRYESPSRFFYASSQDGRVIVWATAHLDRLRGSHVHLRFKPKRPARNMSPVFAKSFGFLQYTFESATSILNVSVPYWFLVLLAGALAVLLKPKPRLKFSLRELLLLTTIAAVVLGAAASLPRLAGE